jgi:hypothetical protein
MIVVMNNSYTTIAQLAGTNHMDVVRSEQAAMIKIKAGIAKKNLLDDFSEEEIANAIAEILKEDVERAYILAAAEEIGVLAPIGMEFEAAIEYIFSFA